MIGVPRGCRPVASLTQLTTFHISSERQLLICSKSSFLVKREHLTHGALWLLGLTFLCWGVAMWTQWCQHEKDTRSLTKWDVTLKDTESLDLAASCLSWESGTYAFGANFSPNSITEEWWAGGPIKSQRTPNWCHLKPDPNVPVLVQSCPCRRRAGVVATLNGQHAEPFSSLQAGSLWLNLLCFLLTHEWIVVSGPPVWPTLGNLSSSAS